MKQFTAGVFLLLLLGACDSGQKSDATDSGDTKKTDKVTGTIRVNPALASDLAESDVLFLIVHKAGTRRGPPVAVKKIESPDFPLEFEIGPEDQMMQGTPFQGPFTVKAKISKSGGAMTQPGDLVGFSKNDSVSPGDTDILVEIDSKAE